MIFKKEKQKTKKKAQNEGKAGLNYLQLKKENSSGNYWIHVLGHFGVLTPNLSTQFTKGQDGG